MRRKRNLTLSADQVAFIQSIPFEQIIRLRLDPLVQVVYRRHTTRVHDQIMDATRRALIELALEKTQGNASQAAEILGIARNTLSRAAERLGLARAGRSGGGRRRE